MVWTVFSYSLYVDFSLIVALIQNVFKFQDDAAENVELAPQERNGALEFNPSNQNGNNQFNF